MNIKNNLKQTVKALKLIPRNHLINFSLLFFLIVKTTVAAPAEDINPCQTGFYEKQHISCVEKLLSDIQDQRGYPFATGYFAALFKHFPDKKAQILKMPKSTIEKAVLMEGLYRAGLKKEAKDYATSEQLETFFDRLESSNISDIDKIKPSLDAKENDRLVGAFFASGNADYIESILYSATEMKTEYLHDAVRFALMHNKFGPNIAPKDRTKGVMKILCSKYECQKDTKRFMQIIVLGSGIWAVQALSRDNNDIKQALQNFLKKHKKADRVFKFETAYFSNYITSYVIYVAKVNYEYGEKFLKTYETFGSPEEVTKAFEEVIEAYEVMKAYRDKKVPQ